VRPWHTFPREDVAALSLAVFKARLDGAVSSLVQWKVSSPTAGRVELDDLSGPFRPKPLRDSVPRARRSDSPPSGRQAPPGPERISSGGRGSLHGDRGAETGPRLSAATAGATQAGGGGADVPRRGQRRARAGREGEGGGRGRGREEGREETAVLRSARPSAPLGGKVRALAGSEESGRHAGRLSPAMPAEGEPPSAAAGSPQPGEPQYLQQVRHILQHGHRKEDRTGTGTISVFGMQARYSLRGRHGRDPRPLPLALPAAAPAVAALRGEGGGWRGTPFSPPGLGPAAGARGGVGSVPPALSPAPCPPAPALPRPGSRAWRGPAAAAC